MDDVGDPAPAEGDAEPAAAGLRGWALAFVLYTVSAVLYYVVASGPLA